MSDEREWYWFFWEKRGVLVDLELRDKLLEGLTAELGEARKCVNGNGLRYLKWGDDKTLFLDPGGNNDHNARITVESLAAGRFEYEP